MFQLFGFRVDVDDVMWSKKRLKVFPDVEDHDKMSFFDENLKSGSKKLSCFNHG